ncbi:putative nitrate reductase [Klebsiella variicola]|uniref:Putative nitrate reductase n=1 Tax=Klebsiella variicola TaxID=244366 RepID=A0A7H4MMG9_KLEVA|nr:putative nitrate reductase [Klebsiella variicola]
MIDPRRTATCEIADRHLALAPGSDGGLFVGLLNAVAQAGACIDGFRDGSQALAEARGWDVAKVADFCGLTVDEVAAFYREFIAAPRAITLYTMGINQSASGSDKCNAIINVHLASGKYGRPGCGPFSLTGQPNAMGGREVGGLATMLAAHMDFVPDDLQRLARFWGTERLAQTPGLTAVELFAAIGRGEVKAVWIMGTNPVVSLPDSHAVSQALAACPLVIVSDVAAQTDTGHFAHIRFPALAWGEKNGTVTNSERRISRQRSFLPPPGEAKADWWIIARVGQALGYREAFAWQHPHDVFREHAALSGFENDGQRAFDIGALADLSREAWDAMAPVRWPVSRSEAAWDIARGWHGDGRLRMVAGDASTDPGDNRCLLSADPQQRADPRSVAHHDPYRHGAAADAAHRGAGGGGGAAGCRSLPASRRRAGADLVAAWGDGGESDDQRRAAPRLAVCSDALEQSVCPSGAGE